MPSMSLLTSGMPAALSVIFRDAVPFWSIQARNASRLAASASKGGSSVSGSVCLAISAAPCWSVATKKSCLLGK